MTNTTNHECKHCGKLFDPKEVAKKYNPYWWTDHYCSSDCVLASSAGYIMRCWQEETVRFSITLPADIYERVQNDCAINSRTVNGQLNFVIRNYYVYKDINDNRL